MALAGAAQATDLPAKQEGRVWIYQPLVLAFSPNWSLTSMPGGRAEFARSRENKSGYYFLEYFVGPNYTYKTGDFTFKASLWYYYMGYPQRGRLQEKTPNAPLTCSTGAIGTATACTSTYNFSHNIELIPSIEYRIGNWSVFNRIIFHNTVYADVYNTAKPGLSVQDQRLGWGTVLRELIQARYAVSDKLGVILSNELFFGILEDGDTKKLTKPGATPGSTLPAGYSPIGYWKNGYRLDRTYFGIDYKISPTLTITPMYMLEVTSSPTDSADVTDVSHYLFVTIAYVAKLFGN
jgi:hypothetical protein